jgi:hypothetical protein
LIDWLHATEFVIISFSREVIVLYSAFDVKGNWHASYACLYSCSLICGSLNDTVSILDYTGRMIGRFMHDDLAGICCSLIWGTVLGILGKDGGNHEDFWLRLSDLSWGTVQGFFSEGWRKNHEDFWLRLSDLSWGTVEGFFPEGQRKNHEDS